MAGRGAPEAIALATGHAVAGRLDAGSAWIHDKQRSHHDASFGCLKGREGIEACLETNTNSPRYDEALT